jgi:hypothetical protein
MNTKLRSFRVLAPVVAFVAAIQVLSISGCAAPVTVARAGDADSPTGGLSIVYFDRELSEQRHRRYELLADGTFRVGSGRAALLGNTDWEGRATQEQIDAILGAAREGGLFDGEPVCEPALVDGKETIFTTIEIAMPNDAPDRRPGRPARFSYRLEGRCPSVLPLRAAFEDAARVRFDPQLNALPQPGLQPRRR